MAIRLSYRTIVSSFLAVAVLTNTGRAIELVNVPCDVDIKENAKCGAGGVFNGDGALSGTFVCRNTLSGLLFPSNPESVCVPTVLNQVIGLGTDTCGCCNGECPEPCGCVCDEEGSVLVRKKRNLWGSGVECVSRSRASRKVGDGSNNYECVEQSACPPLPPPESPPESEETTEETPGTDIQRVEPGE